MKELRFLTEENRSSLQRLLNVTPSHHSRAFVEFALSLGKDLQREYRAGNLRGFQLRGQDLHGVDMRGADLRDADLEGVQNLDIEHALIEGALLGGGLIAPRDSPERWLARWEMLLQDEKYRLLADEVARVLRDPAEDWDAGQLASARGLIARISAAVGVLQQAESVTDRVASSDRELTGPPHPTNLFILGPRWGRQSD